MAACCLGRERRAAIRASILASKEIDLELERWKKDSQKVYKLLLLGTKGAGKSSLIKQMRIIHGLGYTAKDRVEFKGHVYKNVFVAIKILVETMRVVKIDYQSPTNQINGAELAMLAETEVHSIGTQLRQKMAAFWADKGVQTCFNGIYRREFPEILEPAKYYLDELYRISADDFVPSLRDVVRVHVPTTGIVEYTFLMRRDVVFQIIDAGGQRGKMRKWIHCFEGVKGVLFVCAISEYDQVRYEDQKQINQMKESLALLETIMAYPWFVESCVILLFNKIDLFQEKIMTSDIAKYFPAYQGPARDSEAGKSFFAEMFLSVNPDPEKRKIFHHYTCSTDTEIVRRIFEDVKTHILEENLRDYKLEDESLDSLNL